LLCVIALLSLMNIRYVIYTFFLVFICHLSCAQLDTIHYFPPLHSRLNNQVQDHYLHLSTPISTPFTVNVTDGSGNLVTTQTISQGNPVIYQVGVGQTLNNSKLFVDRSNVYTVLNDRGLITFADQPFYAEVRTRTGNQAESFTGKGRNARGRTFRIGGMPQSDIDVADDKNFVFGIMSLENGNNINISDFNPDVAFTLPVGTIVPGGTLNITLDAGETFVFTGYNNVPANRQGILGALVESSSDIVITNGNMNGSIHPTANSRDQGIDQIVPISRLGDNHIVVEGNGNAHMERPMVIAHSNNTEIYINGSVTPIATINAGDFYLIPNSEYQGISNRNMLISTSLPSYVYQHLAGTTNDATGGMCLIPFFHCRLSNQIDLIPDVELIGTTVYTGGILITTEAGADVTINGAPITGSESVSGGPYETYKIVGVTGHQAIESTGSLMVSIFGGSGNVGYAGYYAGFADVPESEFDALSPTGFFCVGDVHDIALVANGGIEGYNFFFTLNGTPNVVFSPNDTLFIPLDTSTPGMFDFVLTGIETYDLDTVNLCFYPSSSNLLIEIDPCGLPIELLDFYVSCDENSVKAKWSTVTERNNAHFNLSLSHDGILWQEIAQIAGAGNSSTQNFYYHYLDSELLNKGLSYIKLNQVDFDGTTEEFPAISFDCAKDQFYFTIYPNPSSGLFKISSSNLLKKIAVFNSLGEIVFIHNIETNLKDYEIDLSHLSNGVYHLQVTDVEGVTHLEKVILNRQ
jgi:hypothetical protein